MVDMTNKNRVVYRKARTAVTALALVCSTVAAAAPNGEKLVRVKSEGYDILIPTQILHH